MQQAVLNLRKNFLGGFAGGNLAFMQGRVQSAGKLGSLAASSLLGLEVLPERAVAACPEDAMFIEDPVWRVALILPGGSLTSLVKMC